ncbi:MAG TPA: ATP-binding protein [Jatrophihabitans sp.]|jgi:anti-sigma regulatory factor (Ser/Thr protein kinase)|nr:ATP-binding protein [Jatrophihabitans sp.]
MATLLVRHTPSSAALARRSVQAALLDSGASDDDALDAALIVGELVGNAVRHAAPLPSGHLAVEWLVERDGYRISVTDGGSQHRVSSRSAAAHETTGRGLAIVAALAQDWGVTSNAGSAHTTVWARGRLCQTGRPPRGNLQTTC